MKKLFDFLKTKSNDEKTTTPASKKSSPKESKFPIAPDTQGEPPRELFSDDYSDIGYC